MLAATFAMGPFRRSIKECDADRPSVRDVLD
jgi:hypothetical protein